MKSEKGLTFIATIVLVVLIVIAVGVAIYFTKNEVKKEQSEGVKTQMLRVQARVQKISHNYTLDKKDEILVGTKLQDMKEEQVVKEFLDKELFNPDEKNKKYYVLNQENINELELENVVLEDDTYYIVEYTASDVYYTKGYDDENGETHYKIEKEEK
jgi:Tfp pilus assembly protein PilE